MAHYRTTRILAGVVALICLSVLYCSAQRKKTTDVDVDVGKILVKDVGTDHLVLGAEVALVPKSKVAIRELSFSDLSVGGIPFYAAPITSPITLTSGERFALPKPLELTVFYRDLATLKPVQAALEAGHTVVHGTAWADVAVPGLAKVVLLTRQIRVPIGFRREVPIEVPGGFLVQQTALRTIALADAARTAMQPRIEAGAKYFSPRRAELWQRYAPALVLAHATFELVGRDETVELSCTRAGLRLENGEVVLPKEILEPWTFDPEVVAALKHDQMRIAHPDLWIWPFDAELHDGEGRLNAATAWRLSAGQISVVRSAKTRSDHVMVPVEKGRPVRVEINRREGASNLVLLTLRGGTTLAATAPFSVATPEKWDELALFRFPEGLDGKLAHPDLIFVPAVRGGAAIKLEAPVDASALGTPLIDSDGIAGFVDSEKTAISSREALRLIGLATAAPARTKRTD